MRVKIVNPQLKRLLTQSGVIVFLSCGLLYVYYLFSYYHIYLTYVGSGLKGVIWSLIAFEIKFNIHGSLLLIPILYASLILGWVGCLITSVCCIIAILPYLSFWSNNLSGEILNIFFLLVISLGIGFFILLARWRRREKRLIIERELERQAYITEVYKAQEEERAHVAHELHDEAVQTLIAMSNRIQSIILGKYGNLSPRVEEQVEWVRDTTIKISQELRRLSRDLRLSILDNLGLLPAINWLVNEMKRNNDIENVNLIVTGEERKLTPKIDVMLFRIVQEALNNIKRHARAKNATISIEFQPSCIRLTIVDDGCGLILPQKISEFVGEGKLGLIGIQQRVSLIGGDFKIKSEINQGTTLSIIVNSSEEKIRLRR